MINKRLILMGLALIIFLFIPTFTPDDLILTPLLIKVFGVHLYIILSIALIIIAWRLGLFKIIKTWI